MHRKIARALATAVLAGAVPTLAACSSSAAAGGHPQSHGQSSARSHGHEHGAAALPASEPLPPTAPNVANPVDATTFRQAPCTALSPEQLHEFGVAAIGRQTTRGQYLDCLWRDHDGPSRMFLMVTFYQGGGLQDIYGHQDNYGYLHALPAIEGFPAVDAVPEDWRHHGFCGTAVGLADDMFVDVQVALAGGANPAPDHDDPCGRSQKVATAVVRNIKGGGTVS
ncbi:DUF3558 domain-containing protein [Gandjariella thermophila]|uniref:DUF3558 domain-containing protein n=1 Tax=Gandjariella thermophila TaxID=1931992 RepID=A0A4D4JCL3_9PSEU|nr:DUF3558 domain-containing protein [Gandjariella thermophila]GDY32398.1 hypothetical protein GTS_40310 [Gandjariella thermophila]